MTTHICPKCHHIVMVPSRHVCNQAAQQTTIVNNTIVEDSSSDLLNTMVAVEVAEAISGIGATDYSAPDPTPDYSTPDFGGGDSGGGGADSSW